MATEDSDEPLRQYTTDSLGYDGTLSAVTDAVDGANSSTTSSNDAALKAACGPDEYIFIFYAYYYGLMVLVTMIGVIGNTAVIR